MNRITKISAVALIALAATFQGFAQDSPLKGKRVLYIYGGWDGHEPVQCRDIFVPWMESEGAIVQTFDNLDPYTDTTIMNNVDLIIQQWTMGTITRQQERGLLNAVRRGVGLAGWHGGTGDGEGEGSVPVAGDAKKKYNYDKKVRQEGEIGETEKERNMEGRQKRELEEIE